MFSIEEIVTTEEFHNLKTEWNELLLKSEANSFFLTWEWLYYWWINFSDSKRLKILLLKDKGELKGIAPFYVCLNEIRLLGSTDVGSDYLDFIIEKDNGDVVKTIFDYLNAENKPLQINLTDLPSQSKSIDYIKKHCNGRYIVKPYTSCPYIVLPSDFKGYLNSLSTSMRYNIKRKRRKFEKDYKGEFEVVRDRDELNKSIDKLFELNSKRMNTKNIHSPFQNKQSAAFHSSLVQAVFDKGWVRLCFLKAEGDVVACIYIFKYQDKYYYYQAGFDPEWEKVSPGFLLFSYCIENAISEGMKEFDFLQGSEEYKFNWSNNMRTNLQIKIYNKKFMGFFSYVSESVMSSVKSTTKRFLLKK